MNKTDKSEDRQGFNRGLNFEPEDGAGVLDSVSWNQERSPTLHYEILILIKFLSA